MSLRLRILRCIAAAVTTGVLGAAPARFHFVPSPPAAEGAEMVKDRAFDEEKGYGFLGCTDEADGAARLFAIEMDEGNHDVVVTLGSETEATSTTIKAEARRLMLHEVKTRPGEFVTRRFTVNVRRPELEGGRKVGLKPREWGPPISPTWDRRLTLEINGENPGLVTMEVVPNDKAVTVFLAGDSTVTDQTDEPWAGWGQMLPVFFKPGIAVSNHAESGLALFSFAGQRRLDKVRSLMKEGDYLFIQFGHNDQKDRREGAGPFTTYRRELGEFIEAAREKGGHPVLVTPMERRRWKGGEPQTTLEDYAEAVRQVGEEKKVPVIDLHAMSLEFYAALGEEDSKRAFVHYPAGSYPGQDKAFKDDTHHNGYGGYELARCVVEGIREEVPDLAEWLVDGLDDFDPSDPDAPETVRIAPSPFVRTEKPDGN